MKVLVVNGSPKGKYSVTLKSTEYLKIKFPWIDFDVIHAGQQIKNIEKDFNESKEKIEGADLIIFSYPVYTFIAPCQLHRFIELMKEHKVNVKDKFVSQISTSKHFYDITAHNYIRDNCFDMEMKYVKGLSADMDDLTTDKGQKELIAFFRYLLNCCDNDYYELAVKKDKAKKPLKVTLGENKPKTEVGEIAIVADFEDDDKQLISMIERFRNSLTMKSKVINIAEYPFKGGCLGCFNCAISGKCVYKDGFDDYLRNEIQSSTAIVYAFKIKDHSMGARFKMYDDRQFCNGHRTVTMGMPIGYLVSGEYSKEANLQMILEGRSEVGGNFLAGIATDEVNPDKAIDQMADTLIYALRNKHTQPANFYGIGGMKIFRDLIFQMQGLMKADHKFYKAHGQYDFPQKKMGRVLAMYLVGGLMASPKVKGKMGNMMNEGMLMPYKGALDKARAEKGEKVEKTDFKALIGKK